MKADRFSEARQNISKYARAPRRIFAAQMQRNTILRGQSALMRERNALLQEQSALIREQSSLLREGLGMARADAEALSGEIRSLAESQASFAKDTAISTKRQQAALENVRMASMSQMRGEMRAQVTSKQLGLIETIEHIRDHRLSFARFGDGEFRLMFRPEFDLRFQKNNPMLALDLRRVLSAPSESVLVGMPHIFYDAHWSTVLAELWHEISPTLGDLPIFGDSHVSRPPIFSLFGEDGVEAWRSVWAGRDVAVIAGKGSRFDLIDPLFSSVGSVLRIDSMPTNAYVDMDRVVAETVRSGRDLALIALGPTGTVLADRLAREGIQAIDIGHLSASYNNVFNGGSTPESRPLTT